MIGGEEISTMINKKKAWMLSLILNSPHLEKRRGGNPTRVPGQKSVSKIRIK